MGLRDEVAVVASVERAHAETRARHEVLEGLAALVGKTLAEALTAVRTHAELLLICATYREQPFVKPYGTAATKENGQLKTDRSV